MKSAADKVLNILLNRIDDQETVKNIVFDLYADLRSGSTGKELIKEVVKDLHRKVTRV